MCIRDRSVAEFPKVLPEEGQDGRGCEPVMPLYNEDGYRLFEVAVALFGIMDADRTHEGSMFQLLDSEPAVLCIVRCWLL